MRRFGLIGYPLTHSFSPSYFAEKFKRQNIDDAVYEAFPLKDILDLPALFDQYPDLVGLNVTIPYKEAILPFLDELSPEARSIGAVNTVLVSRKSETPKLIGYNTDILGFESTLKPLLEPFHGKALVLGSGGASKAVTYVLSKLGIQWQVVSREPKGKQIGYKDVSTAVLARHLVIINTTPLGMHPKVEGLPPLPYHALSEDHLLYDLIYHPAETRFLNRGIMAEATVQNGLQMLRAQADASWMIWNRA